MLYVFLALLSAALFGSATPLSKALLSSFSAFQLAGLLYLGAAAGAAVVAFGKGKQTNPWGMDRKNIFRLSGAVLFGGILAPLLLLLGLRTASAATVSLWLPLELVATALLGRLLFRDHLGTSGWMGMLGVVAASVLLSIGEGASGIKAGFFVMLACFCWGFENNFIALLDGMTPAKSTFWIGLIAGAVNLTIGALSQGFHGTTAATAGAIVVGAYAYGGCIVLFITAAQNIGATRSQILFASSSFFGVVLSAMFLGETISGVQLISIVILAGSLILVFRDGHEHAHTHESLEHEHSHRHDDGHHDHEQSGGRSAVRHSHRHRHEVIVHSHSHWPDLHHRHSH
jgi:drug/metabolite transporter (DMT)-like permease